MNVRSVESKTCMKKMKKIPNSELRGDGILQFIEIQWLALNLTLNKLLGRSGKGGKKEAKAEETDRNGQMETNKKRQCEREAMQRPRQRKVCPGPETYRRKYVHRKEIKVTLVS